MYKYIIISALLVSLFSCSKTEEKVLTPEEQAQIEEQIQEQERISSELDSINQDEVDELINTIVDIK